MYDTRIAVVTHSNDPKNFYITTLKLNDMKKEINNDILETNKLSFKKKSSILPLVLLLIAAGIFAAGFIIENTSDAKMPVLLVGAIIGIFGIAKIFNLPTMLVYGDDKEVLHEEELYFDLKDKNMVTEMLRNGELAKLRAESKDSSNYPLKARIFTNQKGSFILYRIYHFVPYTFEPVTEFEVYKK